MSRINRGRVNEGETIDAAKLNATYDDYSQTDLNRYNTRDQAFDLPHIASDVMLLVRSQTPVLLGTGDKAHPSGSYNTVAALTSGTAQHVVSNSLSIPTIIDWSADPWVIESGDCLRIWWNLSMRTEYTGVPWLDAGADGQYTVPDEVGSPNTISDGFHAWVAWLQWDITDATLTNWEPVSGQMDAQAIGGIGRNGFYVYLMNGGTVISPWALSAGGSGQSGGLPSSTQGISRPHEWFAPYGMFVHAPAQQDTVYGVRLVIIGLVHTAHLASGDEENLLLLDYVTGDGPELWYTSGRMQAVQMRMS